MMRLDLFNFHACANGHGRRTCQPPNSQRRDGSLHRVGIGDVLTG